MASMDIDDLISCFNSSSSISQEASDLAKLQAQLSASLIRTAPRECPTTPTMSASKQLGPDPSSSYPQAGNRPRRGTMVPSRPTPGPRYSSSNSEWERQRQAELEEERDMEMIESSLVGGADAGYHQYHQGYNNAYGVWNNAIPHPNPSPTMSPPVSEPSSYEAYAAMDPFFAAQLQNSQQPFGQPRNTGFGFPSSRSAFSSR
ncbi:hypothetical protein FRB96_000238 [Tulasnella sp. 330]|nr:hypothetical protein FRB96_000238 [Tulasnella sp. 330]KAG8886510.1 hypothetical protein FRB97_003021 [Tulasnella sp. 331]KAG8889768.1 hypothetical protein FRB98_002690 [Tulasnella sp. 332]